MELWGKINEYVAEVGIGDILLGAPAVICAYSGGADSSVLLRFLRRFLRDSGVTLAAAHMNHMIRGDEADRDEALCRDVAAELDIPFYSCRRDIPRIAAECGIGLEECARNERYRFLSSLSKELGGAVVATAHNATDNLETVIFNICRGSGTKGVGGIDPARGIFVRPLLCCTSEEIRDFAAAEGMEYVTDSTNSDLSYTRNYIRHEILPHLRHINPKVDSAALRLGAAARSDSEFISAEAEKILAGGHIMKNELSALPTALAGRVIALMWKAATGDAFDLSGRNISDCLKLVRTGYGSIALGRGKKFCCHKDEVFIADDHDGKSAERLPPQELAIPGVTRFGAYTVQVTDSEENIYNLSLYKSMDFGKIYGRLFVRTKNAGDTVLSGGCHKKLKKLLCDKGVPLRERERLPVICDDAGIVMVPGVAVRDGCLANKDSNKRIYINVEKIERSGGRVEKAL